LAPAHLDGGLRASGEDQLAQRAGLGVVVNGISCPSTTICTAVGHYTEAAGTIDTMTLRYE
jgi:hypothetical protein